MSIKKGDLVMVVSGKPCCGFSGSFGNTFTVSYLKDVSGECPDCGAKKTITMALADTHRYGYDTRRLKKIDPPSTGELDGVPLRLKEPA